MSPTTSPNEIPRPKPQSEPTATSHRRLSNVPSSASSVAMVTGTTTPQTKPATTPRTSPTQMYPATLRGSRVTWTLYRSAPDRGDLRAQAMGPPATTGPSDRTLIGGVPSPRRVVYDAPRWNPSSAMGVRVLGA